METRYVWFYRGKDTEQLGKFFMKVEKWELVEVVGKVLYCYSTDHEPNQTKTGEYFVWTKDLDFLEKLATWHCWSDHDEFTSNDGSELQQPDDFEYQELNYDPRN